MIEHVHPDGEPTPTVRDLYEMKDGLAEAVAFDKDLKPTRFRVTDKGHALLGEIMKRNAEGSIARGTVYQEGGASVVRAREGETNGKKSSWTPS